MEIKRIDGCTRVIGEAQGYIGLPLRDITVEDSVTGPATPAMESAWALSESDLSALRDGAGLILRVIGRQHPPIALYVDDVRRGQEDFLTLHNRIAGEIAQRIVREPLALEGGSLTDVMVLTESVLVGVALACIKLGGDEAVLDTLLKGARHRLAEARLGDLEPAGSA